MVLMNHTIESSFMLFLWLDILLNSWDISFELDFLGQP